MALQQLNFAGLNKVEVAIMRLREFAVPNEPYYFADSFGKDSCLVRDLLNISGVPYETHHNQTGIDPPELVYFGREFHPEAIIEKPEMSIWKAIQTHGMPRRQARWCCEMLKEKSGSGRTVVTGIRWAESARRAKRGMYEVCKSDGTKKFLHPIIDFTTKEVWDYLRSNKVPYCKLYDEGFKRLGCVLCPMETAKQTQFELKRFPKLADAWQRACYRYWERHTEGTNKFETPEAFWNWWLSRKGEPKVKEGQCVLFDN